MSERIASAQFTIGEWRVDPPRHQIARDGEKIVVEPQVMDVLVYLARHAGEVISHDELVDKLWRGSVVSEGAIYQNLAKLRHALHDDSHNPRYIETIPRGGYRLIGDVRFIEVSDLVKRRNRFVSFTQLNDYKLAMVIVTALALGLIFVGYEKFVAERVQEEAKATTSTQIEDKNEINRWEKSVAILPFVNMSGDPDNEYFSDGLSEEILNLLARIPDLKVIGRTSSFSFKGKNDDLRVIGQTLGVKTVLEGSVRKSGDRVRVTAQLVDVTDGSHIWSESYDRTITDIFAVQDDVAAAIIDALQIHVGANPTRGRPTEHTEAYSLFLRARASFNTYEFGNAEVLLLKSIELDPKFAEAYELLATVYWRQAGGPVKAAEGQKLSYNAAAKAYSIDPDLALAQALHQAANVEHFSYVKAIEAFEQAAREQPGNPTVMRALVWYLLQAGYFQEALGVAERLAQLDPLLPAANIRLAETLYAVGRTSESLEFLEVAVQLGHNFAKRMIGEVNLVEKQDDIAITHFEAWLQQFDYGDSNWVRELVTSARDPATGQAYLNRRIPQIVASVPEENAHDWQLGMTRWYLYLGYLDRYFELILDLDLTDSRWTDADIPVYIGTMFRQLGFTAHPKYLEVAEAIGIMDVWEQRGPPDFCEKGNGQWVCE